LKVPFNRPFVSGQELANIAEALASGRVAGDGPFTARCSRWLEAYTGCVRAYLTHSGTAALEMAALLCDIQPGDEVILPSYTFVSTANAFVLRGAVPVFVDVRRDTMNIDEALISGAITNRTKVIVVVHYAGVGCDMDRVMSIAREHGLMVVEDAAQGVMASYGGQALGSIGHLGCLSFHETKNIVSGEGGALLVNDPGLSQRAEVLREKGTNRSRFFRGEVDKYTWVDVGSSYLPSELIAAFLWAQLQGAEDITTRRMDIWNAYHAALAVAESAGQASRPEIPDKCRHNGHMYYLTLPSLADRTKFIATLRSCGIQTVFHYVPLHSSPFGLKAGRISGSMRNTNTAGDCLVRLPLWVGLEEEQGAVIDAVIEVLCGERAGG
jgi:dTDP-4-amino-4,6-dideoxygalactose transaminase